jgi:hypothetical protein
VLSYGVLELAPLPPVQFFTLQQPRLHVELDLVNVRQ